MTKKQLKALAADIAKNEYIIQTSSNLWEVNEAKDKIMTLNMKHDLSLEDMVKLDELVKSLLEKKFAS